MKYALFAKFFVTTALLVGVFHLISTTEVSESIYEAKLSAVGKEIPEAYLVAKESGGLNAIFSEECNLWFTDVSEENFDQIEQCFAEHPDKSKVLIFGDSHAIEIHNSFYLQDVEDHLFFTIADPGCRIAEPKSRCRLYDQVTPLLNEFEFRKVFYTQSGAYLLTRGAINEKLVLTTKASLSDVAEASGMGITWLGPSPEPVTSLKKLSFLLHSLEDIKLNERGFQKIANLDEYLKEYFPQTQNDPVTYVSKIDLMDLDIYSHENKLLYSDEDHWTTYGEEYFGRSFVRLLGEVEAEDASSTCGCGDLS